MTTHNAIQTNDPGLPWLGAKCHLRDGILSTLSQNVRGLIPPVFGGVTSVDSVTQTSVVLHWSTGFDDVTAQANLVYEVCYSTSAAGCTGASFAPQLSAAVGALSVVVGGLSPQTQYYFCVRCRDTDGNEDSNNVTVTSSTLPPDVRTGTQVAITTYAQALEADDSQTILAALYDDMVAAGVSIAGFGDFSVQRAIPELEARALSALEQLRVTLVNAGFPQTAALAGDDWVDVCLEGFFQESRLPATKAQWGLTVSAASSGAGPYSFAPGDLVAQDTAGTTYTCTNLPFSSSAGAISAGGSTLVFFNCDIAGSIGNPSTGAINHLIVSPPGLEVTNGSGSLQIAGADQESSAAYLLRCLAKWGIIGAGGNEQAYLYWIGNAAPTLQRAPLIRTDNPFGPGTVGVWLANAAGAATDEEIDEVTDALNAHFTLGGGGLHINKANNQTINVIVELETDGTNAGAVAQATASLQTLQATYPIGALDPGVVYLDEIIKALMVPSVRSLNFTSPTADTPLTLYSVPVFVPTITARTIS